MSGLPKISLDNAEGLAMLALTGIVFFAAYKAYRVTQSATDAVSGSVAAVADVVSSAYNGVVSATKNAYAEVDRFVTIRPPESVGPLDEAQTKIYGDAFTRELSAQQQRRQADADSRWVNNPMGDAS